MSTRATVSGSMNQLKKMIEETVLGKRGSVLHEEVYLNIGENEIRMIASTHGDGVVAFTTWNEGFLQELEHDHDGNVEAIVDVPDFLNYLDLVGGSGVIDVSFQESTDDRLCGRMHIEGDGEATIGLPASETTLNEIPTATPKTFEDGYFSPPDQEPLRTRIDVDVRSLSKISDAKETVEGVDYFPVVVNEEGELRLELESDEGNSVEQTLATGAEGPPVDNEYNEGFEEVASTLDGNIELTIDQGTAMCIHKRENTYHLRHIVGPVGE